LPDLGHQVCGQRIAVSIGQDFPGGLVKRGERVGFPGEVYKNPATADQGAAAGRDLYEFSAVHGTVLNRFKKMHKARFFHTMGVAIDRKSWKQADSSVEPLQGKPVSALVATGQTIF
jgi:hypothetical protein